MIFVSSGAATTLRTAWLSGSIMGFDIGTNVFPFSIETATALTSVSPAATYTLSADGEILNPVGVSGASDTGDTFSLSAFHSTLSIRLIFDTPCLSYAVSL